MKRIIKNPHWTNNARTILSAEFHYEDGRILTATINSSDTNNPDYQEIRAKFSADQLEQNTREVIRKINVEREKERVRVEAQQEKKRQEDLFALKLKAFEVDAIKNTTNRGLKSAIRRAKSDFEVYALSAALLLDDYNKALEAKSAPVEEVPSDTVTYTTEANNTPQE